MGKRILARISAALLAASFMVTGALAKELVPVGRAVGIEMTTQGMLVASLSKVKTSGGDVAPAAEAGIRSGDIIVRLGERDVMCAEDFTAASKALCGDDVAVTLRRGGKLIQYTVAPAQAEDGSWKLGLWLRDGASGIGTVTFYDPETGLYGALGHAINDVDTGVTLPVGEGKITEASVTGVLPGQSGTPGELRGAFDGDKVLGTIESNTVFGIFGLADAPFEGQALTAASDSEIRDGEATILATVEGSAPREYAANIARVFRGGESRLVVRITDETLLKKTGGIVQGMSGCPIIQNGKLVGAVTHVLLSDPSSGYGISIDQMLAAAQPLKNAA